MGSGEVLMTLVVALIVFGPNKLPTLARHLGILIRKFNGMKGKAYAILDEQMKHQTLSENEKKAADADKTYEKSLRLK